MTDALKLAEKALELAKKNTELGWNREFTDFARNNIETFATALIEAMTEPLELVRPKKPATWTATPDQFSYSAEMDRYVDGLEARVAEAQKRNAQLELDAKWQQNQALDNIAEITRKFTEAQKRLAEEYDRGYRQGSQDTRHNE